MCFPISDQEEKGSLKKKSKANPLKKDIGGQIPKAIGLLLKFR